MVPRFQRRHRAPRPRGKSSQGVGEGWCCLMLAMRNPRVLAQGHPRSQQQGKRLTESILPPSALLGRTTRVLVLAAMG